MIIVRDQLNEVEIAAYNRHSDTFFGVQEQKNKTAENVVEFYDFLYATYQKTAKETLLEFLKDSPDIDQLKSLSQNELASVYCERIAYSCWNQIARKQNGQPFLECGGK